MSVSQPGSAPAVGLKYRVIGIQNDQIGIIAYTDRTLAVVHTDTACGISRAGIDGIVERNHGLLHEDPKPLVDL